MFRLCLGEQWLAAVPVVQILAIGGTTAIFIHAAANLIIAIGRPRVTFSLGIVAMLVKLTALLLLVPLPLLAVGASVGFGLIGGGIYVLVIMPWALRDIWKRAAIPVQAPAAPPSAPRF